MVYTCEADTLFSYKLFSFHVPQELADTQDCGAALADTKLSQFNDTTLLGTKFRVYINPTQVLFIWVQ